MRRGIAMGTSSIALGLMALLAAFMIAAAICDLRNRSIPNGLTGLIAMFAIPFWIANGLAFWPAMPIQIGAAFAVFLAFAGLFALGGMGGGDVTMLGAVLVWIRLPLFLSTFIVMAYAGRLLSGRRLTESN